MSEIKRYKQSTTTTPIMEESADGSYCLCSEVEALLKEKEEQLTSYKELMGRMANALVNIQKCSRINSAVNIAANAINDYNKNL